MISSLNVFLSVPSRWQQHIVTSINDAVWLSLLRSTSSFSPLFIWGQMFQCLLCPNINDLLYFVDYEMTDE